MGRPPAPLRPLTDEQRAMVEQNLGLVGWTLKRHYPHLCFDPDAYQDGVIGLARATRDYEPGRGTFSNYAANWIRSEIGNGIGRLGGRNARRANREGTEYRPPVPLSAPKYSDEDSIADYLAAADDPAVDAVGERMLEVAVGVLRGAVQDPLDEALADRIIARALGLDAPTIRDLVEWSGRAHSTVAYRHRRLIGLLRDELEPVA